MSNSITPWTPVFPVFTISQSFLKLMSIESVMPSNHIILCLSLLFLLSVAPRIRVFSNESALHIKWPKYWSFSISPSNIQDWFPLGLTDLISLKSKGLLRVFSNTTVQKHQFFITQPLYDPTLTFIHDSWKNQKALLYGHLLTKWCICSLISYLGWPYVF